MIDKVWRAVTPLTAQNCFKNSALRTLNRVDVHDTLMEWNAEPSLWEALSLQDLTSDECVQISTEIAVCVILSDA
ncbi:hypothetical protein TNCV_1230551 [Trichonephila clavipes]|nr:hypothetical protein TNCV_1230551 [Trichonephila clavipes]